MWPGDWSGSGGTALEIHHCTTLYIALQIHFITMQNTQPNCVTNTIFRPEYEYILVDFCWQIQIYLG